MLRFGETKVIKKRFIKSTENWDVNVDYIAFSKLAKAKTNS